MNASDFFLQAQGLRVTVRSNGGSAGMQASRTQVSVVGELGCPAELNLMVKTTKLRIFPHSEPPSVTSRLLRLFSLGLGELILLKSCIRIAGHPISPSFQGDALGEYEKEAGSFSRRNELCQKALSSLGGEGAAAHCCGGTRGGCGSPL